VTDLVNRQAGTWLGFIPRGTSFLQPLGLLIFMTAAIAETTARVRLPERSRKLVAGYHTEYSSMSFAMFFLAEYVNMSPSRRWRPICFWRLARPVPPESLAGLVPDQGRRAAVLLRLDAVTLPRYRYDQLMSSAEGAVARLGDQSARDGGGVLYLSCDLRLLRASPRETMISFYMFAFIAWWHPCSSSRSATRFTASCCSSRSFGALSGLYVLLDAPFVAVIQIIIYAGRDHGALPLRRHAA